VKEAVVYFVFLFRLFSWLAAGSVIGRDGGERGRGFIGEKNGYASIEEECVFFFRVTDGSYVFLEKMVW
jgi:hypothetical protein